MAAGSELEVSRRPSLAPPNPSLQRTGRKRPALKWNVRPQKEAAPVVRSQGHSLP